MWKLALVAIMLIILAPGLAPAGEKEDLALKIFVLQEEAQVMSDQFKGKQAAYQKARELMKREPDKDKKGILAVEILKQEEELITLANQVQAKGDEQRAAREKFKGLVDKK